MPKEDVRPAIEALVRDHPSATRAVVYGSPAHHAELAYLNHLVPKLEAAWRCWRAPASTSSCSRRPQHAGRGETFDVHRRPRAAAVTASRSARRGR